MLLDQAITRLFGTPKARNKIYTRSLPRRYKYFVLSTGSRMITTSQQRRREASCIAMRPAIGSFIECVPLDHSRGAMITVEENRVVRFAQRKSRDSCHFAVYYARYRIQLQLIILTAVCPVKIQAAIVAKNAKEWFRQILKLKHHVV
jgi:hypothetical protein